MKRVFALLLALMVLLSAAPAAYAHDVPEERDDCIIELLVRYDGEAVSGGTLTAIRVGFVDEEDGSYFFAQELTGNKLEDVASPGAARDQKAFYDSNKDDYDFYTQTRSVKEGKAVFEQLPTGLYLIVQEQAADGFSRLRPFLIGVPCLEDGVYQYHVTASVKSELEREPEPEPEPTPPPPTTPDGPDIPQTGQLNWPIPLMAVAGLALFAVGWMLCFRKKNKV